MFFGKISATFSLSLVAVKNLYDVQCSPSVNVCWRDASQKLFFYDTRIVHHRHNNKLLHILRSSLTLIFVLVVSFDVFPSCGFLRNSEAKTPFPGFAISETILKPHENLHLCCYSTINTENPTATLRYDESFPIKTSKFVALWSYAIAHNRQRWEKNSSTVFFFPLLHYAKILNVIGVQTATSTRLVSNFPVIMFAAFPRALPFCYFRWLMSFRSPKAIPEFIPAIRFMFRLSRLTMLFTNRKLN